ncbi:MAG: hypothetical protein C0462_14715, partial [Alcanivorax sp.]|nr:hypothetical protein [Alcanivorax sp.]
MAIIFNGNLEINIGPHVRVRRENPVVHKPKRAKRIKWLDPDNMLQTRSRQIITLRVGLFFDGTGNNMENAIAADCQLEYDPEVLKDLEFLCEDEEVEHGREGSHQNAPSNIVRLYELYRDDSERLLKDGDAASIPVYIEGIGTVTGGKDDWYAQITGMGRNGVNSRVEQSPQSIAKRVDELLERN